MPEVLHASVQRILEQPRIEQRSDGWFETRGKLLTASDAGAALSVKPFDSYVGNPRHALIRRKAQQAIGIRDFDGNDATRHGQEYEPVAIQLYEAKTGNTVMDFGLIIHPEHQWLAGSPDGVSTCGVLQEIKW